MLILKKKALVEYEEWSNISRESYKDEIVKNGHTEEEALKKTNEDFSRLLPQGLETPDQYIFSIVENNRSVGTLWFGIRGASSNRKAFVYDIVIDDNSRGRGYGKMAMELLESEVKKLGLTHIGLHVFGHNLVARNLYEKLGYEVTNLNLEKVIL